MSQPQPILHAPGEYVGLFNTGPKKGELAKSHFHSLRLPIPREQLAPFSVESYETYQFQRIHTSMHTEALLIRQSRFISYDIHDIGRSYTDEVNIGTVSLILEGGTWNFPGTPLSNLNHWLRLVDVKLDRSLNPHLPKAGLSLPDKLIDPALFHCVQPISEWDREVGRIFQKTTRAFNKNLIDNQNR